MVINRILIVDDSSVQCHHAVQLARTVLPSAETVFFTAPKLALKDLRAQPVDVVLVDLEMPDMDGVELISHIVNEKLAKALVIVSAKPPSLIASVGVMAESQGMPVLGSLQKPIDADILSTTLNGFGDRLIAAKNVSPLKLEFSPVQLMEGISQSQFFSYYQPKVALQDMTLSGVEALARWQHPEHGLLSPYYFIERMEKGGLIDALTLQLLDQSLAIKQHWNAMGLSFELSINLSPTSLSNTGFTDWVYDHVQVFGIAPSEITFEVTENDLLGDVAKSIQTLARLRLKGFNIAIDDYGTGFANAEQLSRIPATILKLDRSMIHGVASKSQLEKVLKSTVDLANDLGMSTVAEGVELEQDLLIVKAFGIEYVQGFIFARPLPHDDLWDWSQTKLPALKDRYFST